MIWAQPMKRHALANAWPSREPLACPGARLGGFGLAVARRACGMQAADQPVGRLCHVIHRAVESRVVGLGGLREPAQLTHELERRGADFVFGRGRLEVEQRADVTAHSLVSRCKSRSEESREG